VPNSIHSWLNLAPSLPFCVSLIWAIEMHFFAIRVGKDILQPKTLLANFR